MPLKLSPARRRKAEESGIIRAPKERIASMNSLTKVIGMSVVAAGLIGCSANAETGSAKMAAASSEQTVMVGGAPLYPSKNIIENAVNSKDHETPVAAVKAAGLVETLQGEGPFMVFAPTEEAFATLDRKRQRL